MQNELESLWKEKIMPNFTYYFAWRRLRKAIKYHNISSSTTSLNYGPLKYKAQVLPTQQKGLMK